jgi:hypothetical protein
MALPANVRRSLTWLDVIEALQDHYTHVTSV